FVIATLMGALMFYAVLMIFAVNPFAVNLGGAPVDGQGLNYQLRNFYMIIHPPSLYIGFTSATVPFSFVIAALITGRLDAEWINATRKWMLFSWLFLSIGNGLGMLWAYEELGWGGYWAWDPVENAACLPWFTASAYVHSTMIQERRGMLKVWNVVLICATYFLTIFGTFLTRSGLIASVHSFAQSGIGTYFAWYMGLVLAGCVALIVWRLPRLRGEGSLESPLSREAAFVLNNWALLGMCAFIMVATIWPLLSEWLLDQKAAVGPTFYNFWLPIPGVLLFLLMGIAPLVGWRKTSPELLRKGFRAPIAAFLAMVALHVTVEYIWPLSRGLEHGPLRFPPIVEMANLYGKPSVELSLATLPSWTTYWVGAGVARINSVLPVVVLGLCAFNLTVIIQEFVRGVRARQRSAEERKEHENWLTSLYLLVAKSRRRYGGYIVHVGIICMYLGFSGRSWATDKEATLMPGDTVRVDEAYEVVYQGIRRESDPEKMAIIASLDVYENGKLTGNLTPAKFIYKSMPGQPSTEIALHITGRDDLYATLTSANPQNKTGTFRLHVNPLVIYIWIGFIILIIGAVISLWPDLQEQEVRAFSYVRAAAGVTTMLMFSVMLASTASLAYRARTVRQGPAEPHVTDAAWLSDASP
ncbi:MAG: cytochrome c biogenesis protein CcsA, partial [Polyangiaceae bacterium]|nr:cytochrome c biogenesis protein CcsA [Polyangiaceae bacterium]